MSFYGCELDFSPVQTGLPGVGSPRDLYRALLACWCAETCAPRMRERWSPEDPTVGQCSVTAFLAQDLFGGEVLGIPLPEGGFHCFNLVGGRRFDLSSEQFHGAALDYAHALPQSRELHFAREEKRQRYVLLKRRLEQWTGGKLHD